MNKFISFISISYLLLWGSYGFAQTHQGFNYQAIVRDVQGNVRANQGVSLRFRILEDVPTGTAIYTERHNPVTNAFGLVNLVIGEGFQEQGSWTGIDWAIGKFYLAIELDGFGLDTLPFRNVPYAKVATDMRLEDLIDVDLSNLSNGGNLQWNATDQSWVVVLGGGGVGKSAWRVNPDSSISYEAGHVAIGTSSGIVPLQLGSGADVLFGADTAGMGNRLYWEAEKGAFRAGEVETSLGTYWDADSIGAASVAFGKDTRAIGDFSTATGWRAEARGDYAVAMGQRAKASKRNAVAIGTNVSATGNQSVAIGYQNEATNFAATALGWTNIASGQVSSVLGGRFNEASGLSATAMGENTEATGNLSTTIGKGTIANTYGSLAIGRYNIGGGATQAQSTSWRSSDPVFEIGGGNSSTDRWNLLTVLKDGRMGLNRFPNNMLDIQNDDISNYGIRVSQNLSSNLSPNRIRTNPTGIFVDVSYTGPLSFILSQAVGIHSLGFSSNNRGVGLIARGSTNSSTVSSAFGIEAYAKNDNGSGTAYAIFASVESSTTSGAKFAGYFDGDVFTTGSYFPSDAQLKTDIRPASSVLSKVLRLDIANYTYDHAAFPHMNLPEGERTGLVAQNVAAYMPELVKKATQPAIMDGELQAGETVQKALHFQAVDYTGMVPYLIKGIQEQQAMLERLEDRIAELESELQAINPSK